MCFPSCVMYVARATAQQQQKKKLNRIDEHACSLLCDNTEYDGKFDITKFITKCEIRVILVLCVFFFFFCVTPLLYLPFICSHISFFHIG